MGFMNRIDENGDSQGNFTLLTRRFNSKKGNYGMYPIGIFVIGANNSQIPVYLLYYHMYVSYWYICHWCKQLSNTGIFIVLPHVRITVVYLSLVQTTLKYRYIYCITTCTYHIGIFVIGANNSQIPVYLLYYHMYVYTLVYLSLVQTTLKYRYIYCITTCTYTHWYICHWCKQLSNTGIFIVLPHVRIHIGIFVIGASNSQIPVYLLYYHMYVYTLVYLSLVQATLKYRYIYCITTCTYTL